MKKFALVHNIPSPYRLHFFCQLSRILAARQIDLTVHFMSTGYDDRPHWIVNANHLRFKHKFWRDSGPTLHGKTWHLNWTLILAMLSKEVDYLLISGPWDSLTGAIVSIFSRARLKIAWYESNTSNPGRVKGLSRLVKKFLLSRFDYIALPGSEGVAHARLIMGTQLHESRILLLPNLVDERRFLPYSDIFRSEREQVRMRLGISDEDLLAIWPARLIWEKGIPEFLNILDKTYLDKWRVLIIGEGPLEAQIKSLITERRLDSHIRIISYFKYDEMPKLYRAADLFLLPSLSDQNPLSVVEALWSGLPIMLSRRAGNFPEAIVHAFNGWAYDPSDSESAKMTVKSVFRASRATLREMGKHSSEIAQKTWTTTDVIERFTSTIIR